MNLREGTRRLALLLGGAGAITGCALGYLYLQPIVRQRDLHNSFERFANSDVVKEQRKILQSPDPFDALARRYGGVVQPPPKMTMEQFGARVQAKYPEYKDMQPADLASKVIAKYPQYADMLQTQQTPVPHDRWDKFAIRSNTPPPPSGYAIDPKTGEPIDPYAAIAKPLPSEVNKGGIAKINWSGDYGVTSIETTEGETLSPTPAPAIWEYLLVALFPLLGFLIPWGAIRAIGWVLSGFVQPSK